MESITAEKDSFLDVRSSLIITRLKQKLSQVEEDEKLKNIATTKSSSQSNNTTEDSFVLFCNSLSSVVDYFYSERTTFLKEYWDCNNYFKPGRVPDSGRVRDDELYQGLVERFGLLSPSRSAALYNNTVVKKDDPSNRAEKAEKETLGTSLPSSPSPTTKVGAKTEVLKQRHFGVLDFKLLDSLFLLLLSAQYKPLEPEMYELAKESAFEVNFPTSPNWRALDLKILPLWYEVRGLYADSMKKMQGESEEKKKNKEEKRGDKKTPEAASPPRPLLSQESCTYQNGCFICTRGVKLLTSEGYFPFEKVDLLFLHLWSKVEKFIFKRHSVETQKRLSQAANSSSLPSAVFGTKIELKRYTLHQFMLENGWVKGLFMKAKLYEPAFSNVIIVNRPTAESVSKHSSGSREDTSSSSPSSTTSPSAPFVPKISPEFQRIPMRVTEYLDVPFGDLEAVLPYCRVGLAPLDSIKFALQLFFILSFLHLSFNEIVGGMEGEESESFQVMALLAVLLIGLVSRLISAVLYYVSIITYYERDLEQWLMRKCVGTGPSVVAKLCDEVCVQETKEMLLAYHFLLQHQAKQKQNEVEAGEEKRQKEISNYLTLQELDSSVERFLKEEFHQEVDFDAEDAVTKLLNVGLATAIVDETKEEEAVTGSEAFDGTQRDSQKLNTARYKVIMTPQEWVERHPVQHFKDVRIKLLD